MSLFHYQAAAPALAGAPSISAVPITRARRGLGGPVFTLVSERVDDHVTLRRERYAANRPEPRPLASGPTRSPAIRVDAVIPVYNEAHVLAQSVSTLHHFLSGALPYDWRIVIADNASVDGTLAVAEALAARLDRVAVVHLDRRGRGRALRTAWLESDADVLSYMDVDLSTDLAAYPALIRAVAEEGYDLATGSRLAAGSRTTRSPKREVISRGYNLLIKAVMRTRFSDAQCGFKAISREAADTLVPLVENNRWFFDTELLVRAEQLGYQIKDIPVRWVEDPDTRVKLGATIREDLAGLWRLRTHPIPAPTGEGLPDSVRVRDPASGGPTMGGTERGR